MTRMPSGAGTNAGLVLREISLVHIGCHWRFLVTLWIWWSKSVTWETHIWTHNCSPPRANRLFYGCEKWHILVHNGLKFMSCCMHVTPSHCHHYADLFNCVEHIRWKILEACVNACWSVELKCLRYGAFSRLPSSFSLRYMGFYVLNWPMQV